METLEQQIAARIAAAREAAGRLPPGYRLERLRWRWPTGWITVNGALRGEGRATIEFHGAHEFRGTRPPRVEAVLDVVVAEDLPWVTLRLRAGSRGVRTGVRPADSLGGNQRTSVLGDFAAVAPRRLARHWRIPEALVRHFLAAASGKAVVRRCGHTAFLIRAAGNLAGTPREFTFRYERTHSGITIANGPALDRRLAEWIASISNRAG